MTGLFIYGGTVALNQWISGTAQNPMDASLVVGMAPLMAAATGLLAVTSGMTAAPGRLPAFIRPNNLG